MERREDVVLVKDVNNDAYVLPGASITVYIAGTSTPATLYSDEGMTPLANPVTSDSKGRYSYYAANGVYDEKIEKIGYATDWRYAVSLSDLSVTMGAWLTPTFNAADFTAFGAMTWTVEAADVVCYQYMIIGKTMWVSFALDATSVGGTPNVALYIKVPAGKVIASPFSTSRLGVLIDNSVVSSGRVIASAGNTILSIYRADSVNFTAATNTTYVYGQIFFEIQ
jgi:hypothetical protein